MNVLSDPRFTHKLTSLSPSVKNHIRDWVTNAYSSDDAKAFWLKYPDVTRSSQGEDIYIAGVKNYRIFFTVGHVEDRDFIILLDIDSKDDIEQVVKFDNQVEEDVASLLRQLKGRTVPGRLFNVEEKITLPEFHTIINGGRFRAGEADIIANAANKIWVVEVKVGEKWGDDFIILALNSVRELATRLEGIPWLVTLSEPSPKSRDVAKSIQVMLTGGTDLKELQNIVLEDSIRLKHVTVHPNNPLAISELNHVAIHVRDLDASIRFYGDVLGLPSLPRPDFGLGGAWFEFGSQELHLITADPTDTINGQSFHYALRVHDAYAASVVLQERGITEFRGPAPRPDGAVQIFLQDPDGYVIELVSFPASAQ